MRKNERRNGHVALAITLAFGVGCPSSTARSAEKGPTSPRCTLVRDGFGPPGRAPVRADVVVRGLEVPWGIAFLSSREMLVTERPGRVRLVRDFTLVPEPVATIDVVDEAEGGLLGIALHPEFSANGLFYVYLTVKTKDGSEPNAAQDLDAPSGKVLRLTADGAVPPDNPWPGKAAFITGVRNTEGFDWWDSKTLIVTDHGPSGELDRKGHDEVNVAKPGDNLGWPTIFGCEARQGLVSPLLTWQSAAPPGGAAIYRGTKIPEWKGSLLIGVLGGKHLHRVAFDAADPSKITLHETYFDDQLGRLRDVAMGPDGELYVTTSNCDGRGSCPKDKDQILRVTR